MNGYKAFYNGKTADIYARTMFEARDKASLLFKVRPSKLHMISVVLCEKDGEIITHNGSEF